jgi:hypothetical protein
MIKLSNSQRAVIPKNGGASSDTGGKGKILETIEWVRSEGYPTISCSLQSLNQKINPTVNLSV